MGALLGFFTRKFRGGGRRIAGWRFSDRLCDFSRFWFGRSRLRDGRLRPFFDRFFERLRQRATAH